MVLLLLAAALEARLKALQSQLPRELADLVATALAPSPAADGAAGGQEGEKKVQERTVSHELLVKVSRWARTQDNVSCSLSSLLAMTDIHAPPLPPRHRSAELESILSKISLQRDQASYASMTSIRGPQFVSSLPMTDYAAPSEQKSIADEWTEVRRQLSAVVNVLASMGTVATGVWWVGGGRSVQARLGLSMFGAIAIAAIEAFLYYRFFTREGAEEGPKKARRGKPREGVLKFEVPSFPAVELKKAE